MLYLMIFGIALILNAIGNQNEAIEELRQERIAEREETFGDDPDWDYYYE